MSSKQKHVNPITVKRLLRISPRATSRTSPRTPPILRLDEDSLRKIFDKYNETVTPKERIMARNILKTTDKDTLSKIIRIVKCKTKKW